MGKEGGSFFKIGGDGGGPQANFSGDRDNLGDVGGYGETAEAEARRQAIIETQKAEVEEIKELVDRINRLNKGESIEIYEEDIARLKKLMYRSNNFFTEDERKDIWDKIEAYENADWN